MATPSLPLIAKAVLLLAALPAIYAVVRSYRSPKSVLAELDADTTGTIVGFSNTRGDVLTEPYLWRGGFQAGSSTLNHYQVWFEYQTPGSSGVIRALQNCGAAGFERSGLRVGATVDVRYLSRNPRRACFVVPGDPTSPMGWA